MPGGVTATTLPGMTNIPPPAEELRLIDTELRHLDARRAVLLRRRAWLVHTLYAASAQRSVAHSATVPPVWPAGPGARRPEAAAPSVQNVLLVLGGVLLTIAAIAFTLVSWGEMGIAGRAAVLGAVTLAALGTPVVLLRRGLAATAEAVAGLGIALTVLDAYALHEVVFTGADGTGYTAAAAAVLAALWAGYGVAVDELVAAGDGGGRGRAGSASAGDGQGAQEARPGAAGEGPSARAARSGAVGDGRSSWEFRFGLAGPLMLPLPLALAAAQLPLLLGALAAGAGVHTLTALLLLTAAADTAVAFRTTLLPVRLVAATGALLTGAWGVLSAGSLCWGSSGPGAAARAAAILVLAAAIALGASRYSPHRELAVGTAVVAGLCVVAAGGGVLRAALPGEWTVPGCLALGIALLGVARTRLPEPMRQGLTGASMTVQGLAVLSSVPLVAGMLLGPVGRVGHIWSGAPDDIRAAVFTDMPWPSYTSTVPLVLATVAGVLATAGRGTALRPAATTGALILGWATALVFPSVLELPYAAGLVALGAVTAAMLGGAEWARRAGGSAASLPAPAVTALVLALLTSVDLALVSLASEGATTAALAALTLMMGAAATRPGLGPVTAPAALVYATALACASGAWAGWPAPHIALLVLVVPAVAALVASRTGDSPVTVPVEVTGAVAGLLAVGLAVVDPPMLALVLSLGGVITAATALRPERRQAGYAATVLFLLAGWVRLVAWEVTAPEAYTLPVSVALLVVGFLRRRRDAALSSWTAYGAGLAVTLVPSLMAAWGDEHWLRPLLLGTGALAVTLVGARHRLRAPLALGGSVLALVALHELAPYIAQVVGALPRWVPPALAGLVLLVLGATYEQRLRDARRVREAFGRLR